MAALSRRMFVSGFGAGALGLLTAACSLSAPGTPGATTAAATPGSAAAPAATGSAIGGATAASGSYAPTPLARSVTIRAIDTQNTALAPAYLAQDRGYLQAEGLGVDYQTLNDVSTGVQTLTTNKADFMATTPDPVIFNALARGIDIRVVASTTVNAPADHPAVFLVRSALLDAGGYTRPSDLRGKTVVASAASSQFYIDRFLQQDGLTLDDVNTVMVRGPDTIPAFANGIVDAGWVIEPTTTQLTTQGLARIVATTGQLFPGAVGAALIMSAQFGIDQRPAAERFLIAWVRGARDYDAALAAGLTDTSPVVQSLVDHTLIKDPKVYSQIGLSRIDPTGTTDPVASWNVFQEFYVRRGIQERAVDIAKYVDFSYANAALDRLGRAG